jgi:hypothetical protein
MRENRETQLTRAREVGTGGHNGSTDTEGAWANGQYRNRRAAAGEF